MSAGYVLGAALLVVLGALVGDVIGTHLGELLTGER